MEDIRFIKNKKSIERKIKINNFFNFFKKKWLILLIVIIITLIIIYPEVTGHLLGSWWNDFASSFIEKITY